MRLSRTRAAIAVSRGTWTPALLALSILVVAVPAPGTAVKGDVPPYTETPVFYDRAWEYYGDKANLTLAHEAKLKLGAAWIIPIDTFAWSGEGQTMSYWVAMESFRYLLPLIDSSEPHDQEFVRDWIRRWLDTHEPPSIAPNRGASDAMSVGKRAMTFVWHLQKLSERGESDGKWTARVKRSILWHQEYLRDHYGTHSNHGFWVAMGLFETTRVHPDSSLTRLALERLAEMVDRSVSRRGLHMEHSPAYHFFVWNWLRQYVDYFGAMGDLAWAGFPALEDAEKRLRFATYYLYDHNRNLAQIGDTDAKRLTPSELPSEGAPDPDPVMYDEEAGYAIYKDVRERYVVFCIQNQAHPIWMPYHYHDDVLSVYYSSGGEVILGDQGRHSYVRGEPMRDYFLSNAAHNTIVPTRLLGKRGAIEQVDEVSWNRGESRELFRASRPGGVTRTVEIPRDRGGIRVIDTIEGGGSYTVLWNLGHDIADVSESPAVSGGDVKSYAWSLTTRGGRTHDMRVSIRSARTESVRIAEGEKNPHLGWYSSGRLVEIPSKVVVIEVSVDGRAEVETSVTASGP